MHVDVRELRDFYLSPQGRMVRQIVSSHVRAVWPDAKGRCLLGVGHATPYLRPFLAEAERVIAMMPAGEGVLHWPPEGPNRTALAFETQLPLPDASVDLMLIVHALEVTDRPGALLREAWRVLAPGGRILAVVPHRTGLWANAESTPFGNGRPFTQRQLTKLAATSMFAPLAVESMLFVPPTRWRFVLGSARSWERIGRWLWPNFPGVIALEAEKRMMQGVTQLRPRRARIFAPALMPARTAAVRQVSAAAETRPARRTGSRTTTAR